MGARLLLLVLTTGLAVAPRVPSPQAGATRTPSDDLAILEAPDRDAWQQPDRVMDALNIAEASRVADVGAGSGWFTARLARRVGPNGRVYAEDIQPDWMDYLNRRIPREGLKNVELILGTADDPRLPSGLHAVLVVNTFPLFRDPAAMLRSIAASLAPNGQLGIVDFRKDGDGGPGPALDQRVTEEDVRRAATAAGLQLRSRETFLRYQFLLVFTKRVAE